MTILSTAEFELVLAEIEQRTDQIQREAQRLIAIVRHQGTALGPLYNPLGPMLIWIDAQAAEVLASVARILPYPGKPFVLRDYGNEWSGPRIAGCISNQVAKTILDEVQVDRYWTGPAADTYKSAIARQREALSAVVGFAQSIDNVLTGMAIAIGAFWLAILAALLELALLIIIGVAGAITGVGAPPGVAAVVAGIAKFLGVFMTIVMAVQTVVLADTLPKIKDLYQDLHDNSAFLNGRWPRPLDDLFDGGVIDGDPSDWQVKGTPQ